MGTAFSVIYNRFLGKITDDMYLELTPLDTIRDLRNLLIEAIPGFEFPRKRLDKYILSLSTKSASEITESDFVIDSNGDMSTVETSMFEEELSDEEVNILATLMLINWTQRQITSIENTRMKYSGSDFKFTS
jgi:GTPase Era involved in 16S rRNA processing